MITREQAVELAARGLPWSPRSGDRFHIPDRDLDEEVFVVAGMSIEVADLPSGAEVRFNGTVEWALDSIAQSEVIWLPREDQLREALGPRFLRLESVTAGYAVVLGAPPGPAPAPAAADPGPAEVRHVDVDAERAYARALLSVLSAPS